MISLSLGLFNSEQHRIHVSVATLVDMDIMAAAVNTDAMGGFAMHIPTADDEDREIKRGTLMGKAHKLANWMPTGCGGKHDREAGTGITQAHAGGVRGHTEVDH
jgi:hypothetical protein